MKNFHPALRASGLGGLVVPAPNGRFTITSDWQTGCVVLAPETGQMPGASGGDRALTAIGTKLSGKFITFFETTIDFPRKNLVNEQMCL